VTSVSAHAELAAATLCKPFCTGMCLVAYPTPKFRTGICLVDSVLTIYRASLCSLCCELPSFLVFIGRLKISVPFEVIRKF
jgi:hypothetical protein